MRKSVFLFFGIILMLSLFIACCRSDDGNNVPVYGLHTETIVIDGSTRRYAIYVPETLGNSIYPLIIELHGGGTYIEDMTGENGNRSPYKLWMTLADAEKFIVVYPEGMDGIYNKPSWNDCRSNATVLSDADDVRFISALIEEISLQYPVDTHRIYASGTSNGGFMVLRLAAELSDKIAAVAATAASMPDSSECNIPVNPISVLFMNGTDDNYVPYNGGTISNPPDPDHGTTSSTEASVDFWIEFDQTDTVPVVYDFPNINTEENSMVTRYSYGNGMEGTEVILYKINGGGHTTPSILEQYSPIYELLVNEQNHDIEMSEEVWEFFKEKTLD